MTELEVMQRAKMYMDKLARGIDPTTGREVPWDSTLNNPRLGRCFAYVSEVLGRVIDNGGTVGKVSKTAEFSITPEQLSRVRISDYPVRITELTQNLYQAVNDPQMKQLSTTKITQWLIDRELMVKQTGPEGKSQRIPTQRGLQMGMSTQRRQSRDGEYLAVYYDRRMQLFILDHLSEILADQPRNTDGSTAP